MTAPAVQTHQVRCHHCQNWIGESPVALEFVGLFKSPSDRTLVTEPRVTHRCKSCGWVTVFRPLPTNGGTRPSWRTIELKQSG